MTTIALIGVTAFAVYLYITKRLERNRAENYKLLFENKSKSLENLKKKVEKEAQMRHYYKTARFGEAYGKTGKLSDTLEAYENPEAAAKCWAQSKQAQEMKERLLNRFNREGSVGKVHDGIIVIGEPSGEDIEAIKKQLDVKRGTWKSDRAPIAQNLPKRETFEMTAANAAEVRTKILKELEDDAFSKARNIDRFINNLYGNPPTDEIQSEPRSERTVSSFAIAKLNLLKRFIDMNLIENERGSTPHRLPYAKESLTLEIKDNIDGTIGVYYDGVEVKPKDVSIINSFLEKTKGYGIRK